MSRSNMTGTSVSSTLHNAEWQRVSPIAVVYFLLKNIQHALNLWPALIGMLANQHARAWLFSYGIPVLVCLVLGVSFLSYWFFRYQFDAEKIQIRSGIFQKKRLTLNFERIQEANLEQAIYFRPFSLWTLRLESAGSSKEEIALPGISEMLAAAIKQRVLSSKEIASKASPVQPAATDVDYVVQLNTGDLIRYGLMHNTLVYLVAILAPLLSQNDSLWRALSGFVERLGVTRWLVNYLSQHGVLVDALLVMLLLALFFIAIYSVSILLAIIKYWNYKLTVQGERLQYEAGLFNRVACGFRKHKLQTVIIKQSFIARLLKRYSLEIRQTNETVKQGAPMQGFIIPVLNQIQLEKIMEILEIEFLQKDSSQWQRGLAIQIFWNSAIWGGLLTAAVAVFVVLMETLSLLWVLLPLPMVAFLCWKYWHALGYALTGNDLAVRRGLLGSSITYIPHIKVQKLQRSQGPLGRIHGFETLSVWSGATRETVGYLDSTNINICYEHMLQKVATYRGRWM